MITLRSYVCGSWHEADKKYVPLVNPSTEEEIARVSSHGVDFGAALAYARDKGGPALRAMTFAERSGLLKEMARVLKEHRDELLDLSRVNTGTTRPDGSFDVDGASGTLAYYAGLGRRLGDRRVLVEGDGVQLARTEAFWGQHVLVPRQGVAVCINAFNFPAWGFAEKAACALLAGMPVITKPATATAMVTERCVELVVRAQILPEGALQLVCGGTGDLLDLLGAQDVLAFTGSADTAAKIRDRKNLLATNTRINVEADSVNAAVLAPGSAEATRELFLRDVMREMTQKTGQKCTAVRRVLVPAAELDAVQEELVARLAEVVTGNPEDSSVTMGPLATAAQLKDTEKGVAEYLKAAVRVIHGPGTRHDGVGSPEGKGYFFPPTLMRCDLPAETAVVHEREIFGPVATLMPYSGEATDAALLVARAGGTLVTSVYGDDGLWTEEFLAGAGSTTGRIYLGSEEAAGAAPGSGIALPQTLHGGPGRAGGGEELGGLVGVRLYMQRLALQGDRAMVEGVAGLQVEEPGPGV